MLLRKTRSDDSSDDFPPFPLLMSLLLDLLASNVLMILCFLFYSASLLFGITLESPNSRNGNHQAAMILMMIAKKEEGAAAKYVWRKQTK